MASQHARRHRHQREGRCHNFVSPHREFPITLCRIIFARYDAHEMAAAGKMAVSRIG